jgi:L-aspartate oxidase
MKESCDFLVLGSGIAGLSFALKVARFGTVCVLTKKDRAESNTNYAQGGIACVTSQEDSFETHVGDTLRAGDGLCREEVVRVIVGEGPPRIQELIELGVQFTEREGVAVPEYDLGKEGGHTKRRVLHAADMTGREIERGLLEAVAANPQIEVRENWMGIDLVTSGKLGMPGENRCLGIYAFDGNDHRITTIGAKVVILATGGCGRSYVYTSNPGVATGDGVAMAFRAGVPVVNMEFIQFHPTCFYHPLSQTFLISEALRGEGARLINGKGREFAQKYDSRGAMASRDIVARAIDSEVKRSGEKCVYLDISHRDAGFLKDRFPNIYEYCLRYQIDMTRDPIPVVPAAHYQCGGVQTGLDAATVLPGLLAIGEVASTGLHGANRLASNSLLEAVVMAHRAVETAHQQSRQASGVDSLPEWQEGDAFDPDEQVVVSHNWREIRQLMWDYVSIVRTDKRLRRALSRLETLKQEIKEYYWDFKVTADLLELRNICEVSQLIVRSALQRRESRGLHYNLDYPAKGERATDTVLIPENPE